MSDQRPFLERRQSTRLVDSTLQTASWLSVCNLLYIVFAISTIHGHGSQRGGYWAKVRASLCGARERWDINQAQMYKTKSHAVKHVIVVVVVAIVVPPVASLGQGSRRGD